LPRRSWDEGGFKIFLVVGHKDRRDAKGSKGKIKAESNRRKAMQGKKMQRGAIEVRNLNPSTSNVQLVLRRLRKATETEGGGGVPFHRGPTRFGF
jgi:hypothetical protein